MVVRGPRLSLRYGRADDAPALYELGRDPEVSRFFSWGPYTHQQQASAFIERMAEQRAAGERLEFVIADEHDRPLGITGLSELSARDRRAFVGTWLGRRHWGTRANAESKALILALGFRVLDLQRVSAYAHPRTRARCAPSSDSASCKKASSSHGTCTTASAATSQSSACCARTGRPPSLRQPT